MTNIVIPRTWLKSAMVLSVLGFGLCLAVIADVFVGTSSLFAVVVMPLFVAVFPLYFGAVSISLRRMKSDRRTAWKVLFRGLPSWFLPAFHGYFYIVGLGMLTGFVQLFRGQPGWIGLAFVLLPSVFYLASVGAYWSELRERATVVPVPGVPPLVDPLVLEGYTLRPRMKARSLLTKHWLRMLPTWLSIMLFVVYCHLDPQMKFDNTTYIMVCLLPLVLATLIGTLLSIKVMRENDYPFVDKGFLLVILPVWAIAFLTHFACVLIFWGWASG